jgi:hypothetical protein
MYLMEKVYEEPRLDAVDQCFANIIGKCKRSNRPDCSSDLEMLGGLMREVFGIQCVVEIYPASPGDKFFFMSCSPSVEDIMQVSNGMARGEKGITFDRLTGVVVTLDGKALDRAADGAFTAKEMTAVLLHEVGHKADLKGESNWATAYLATQLVLLGLTGAALAVIPGAGAVIAIPLAFILSSGFVEEMRRSKIEQSADSMAISYGYGPELHSVLKKLGAMAESQRDTQTERKVQWAATTLLSFHHRRAEIIRELERELREAKTDSQRKLISEQLRIIRRA